MLLHTCNRGWRFHPAYTSWRGMKNRCRLESNGSYPRYGGRGITYCDRWEDFASFWLDMGTSWTFGLQLDRKDNNGNYTPDNCKWSTRAEQAANKSQPKRRNTPCMGLTRTELWYSIKGTRSGDNITFDS